MFKPLRPVVEQLSSFYLAYEKKSKTQKGFFRFLHFFKQIGESVSAKTTHDENDKKFLGHMFYLEIVSHNHLENIF